VTITSSQYPRNKKPARQHRNAGDSCIKCGYALYPATGRCTNWKCPRHDRKPGAMTLEQISNEYVPPPLFHGRTWGEWVLDTERLCLVFRGKPVTRGEGPNQYVGYFGIYEIDIERISDSPAMLDWIYQFGGKIWAAGSGLKDLINAFDDVFDPQASLCSGACGNGGGGKVIKNPGAFLRKRIATVGKTDGPLKDAA
jgi:hypothetical protein